jgi:regulator of nonsense transcripts 2
MKDDVGLYIVDGILEDIRLGLEVIHPLIFILFLYLFNISIICVKVNLPKYNQRRVSIMKYLGELYNYRMVESSIIFKTLYLLITFRVSYDRKRILFLWIITLTIALFSSFVHLVNEAKTNEFDPIDNFFRVRLVCVLLETCGQYFDRGSTKKKLDCFLVYFQVD